MNASLDQLAEVRRERVIADVLAWPEPVNILGELSAPAFSADDAPAVLAEYPLAYARATGFDPSLTLSAAVTVAAAALSDKFQIVADSATAWFQQARIWLLAIAAPGAAKTPSQKDAAAPLWTIQGELRERHERELAALGDDDAPLPRPRVIVADTTIEALSEALRDNPRGLLIANDEFESWLGSLDTYRRGAVSRDRGEWLRAFDGGPHTIERVQRGSVYVPNWGVSILSATTPAALAKMSRHLPEDGLLQRFIPVIGRRTIEAEPVEGLPALREHYTETIRRLYFAVPRAHGGCVPLGFEAAQFLRDWMRKNQLAAEAFGSIEPALEAHLAKHPTLLLRLSLVFHAVDVVNQPHELARDPAAFPVSLATMQTAAQFLKRSTAHALAVYLGRSGGSEPYELAREVGRAILGRGWELVTRRDLIQGVRAFRKAEQPLQDATLRLFCDLAWLRASELGYEKPVPARYDVNPALAAKFAAIAERERERRAIVREAIAEAARDRRQP